MLALAWSVSERKNIFFDEIESRKNYPNDTPGV